MTPVRLTVVLTHPVQYYSAWFRDMAAACREIELTVLYATRPTPEQQGVGFDRAFDWDVPLLEGYCSKVLGEPGPRTNVHSDAFFGADAPGIGAAILETRPDAVLVMGWHSSTYLRAMWTCRRHQIPLLVRGDTNLQSAPRGWRRPIWMLKSRLLLSSFAGCLAVGVRTAACFRYLGVPGARIFRVPHSVDNEWFGRARALRRSPERARIRERWGIPADRFVVMFAGKLESKKRPHDAIRAAAMMDPRPHLLIAGSGPLEAACRADAAHAGVAVSWTGFLNQSAMVEAYAAADCLVLPSDERETWGLVVNEALAAGLPCVVSDKAGCAPDVADPAGLASAIVPLGDVAALAGALSTMRRKHDAGADLDGAAARLASTFSFQRATEGLLRACESAIGRTPGRAGPAPLAQVRAILCGGGLVVVGGMERMSFQALDAIGRGGGAVHCIVNEWENHRIAALADDIGASWTPGFYHYAFARRGGAIELARAAARIARTSLGLLRETRRFRATHIFVPEFVTVIRNLPALIALRALGITVILRLGNAPPSGSFYRRLWRWVIQPAVDRFVCNSEFTARELLGCGVARRKVSVIWNAVPARSRLASANGPRDPGKVIYVGQVLPEKGVDLLLDAAGLLVGRGIDVRVDIVGSVTGWADPAHRPYRDRMLKRAAEADLAMRVRFLGWRDDVPQLMSAAAIHCCPSRPSIREGFGVVVVEAKHAGLPSIVTRSGALPSLVSHGEDGWVCEEATAEAIAAGLEHFLHSPARLAAAAAAARASLSRFRPERFAAEWAGVFLGIDASRDVADVTHACVH